MATALSLVQQFYPNVKTLTDGSKDIEINVGDKDIANAQRRKHPTCALAVACKREYQVKGIIVALSVAYLITKDDEAIRYMVPQSTRNEIIIYDRNGEFAPGSYHLSKPTGLERLGSKPHRVNPNKGSNGKTKGRYRHLTENVRSFHNPE
jgi:hypothetical protein